MQREFHIPLFSVHHSARVTAVAAVALCVAVGGWVVSQSPKPIPELSPPPVEIAALQPPLVITVERNADWYQPQHVPAPRLEPILDVPGPQLAALEFTSSET